jgi:transcriptional regulator with XRE-family HTH domain
MLGQRLKQLRASKSINQIQLAQELGVNQGTVGKWETDTRKPDVETLKRLADYFDVTMDYLLGEEACDPKIVLLTRDLNRVPEQDREFLLDNLKNTMDIYFKSKGIT